MIRKIDIYTDGGCYNVQKTFNAGVWAFVAVINDEIVVEKSGVLMSTTSNRCELYAIIQAIKWAKQNATSCRIISDSSYAVKGINEWRFLWASTNFKNGAMPNADYWEVIHKEFTGASFEVIKVKGHSGDRWNTYADCLCTKLLKGRK